MADVSAAEAASRALLTAVEQNLVPPSRLPAEVLRLRERAAAETEVRARHRTEIDAKARVKNLRERIKDLGLIHIPAGTKEIWSGGQTLTRKGIAASLKKLDADLTEAGKVLATATTAHDVDVARMATAAALPAAAAS